MFVCDYLLKCMATGCEVQFVPDEEDRNFKLRPATDGFMSIVSTDVKVNSNVIVT